MKRRVFVSRSRSPSCLLLEDGSFYLGTGVGAQGFAIGELCFNTSHSGYQEILSDPSYAEQIIVFSFPHIGNVGVCLADDESDYVYARGCIFSQVPSAPSNWRSAGDFASWLECRKVIGLYGLDTRTLVRRLRDHGSQRAAIINAGSASISKKFLLKKIRSWPGLVGAELARSVGSKSQYLWYDPLSRTGTNFPDAKDDSNVKGGGMVKGKVTGKDDSGLHIVAVDFGIKRNILRCLRSSCSRVTVVPPESSSSSILSLDPDGIFLSNGPGDPEASARYAQDMVTGLISTNLPIFGICLGFQLLSLAFGARSEKMSFGHHGSNHPVKDLRSGRVEITSQNHGFTVALPSLPDALEVTHISLFDDSLEGFVVKDRPIFAVQYHPESSPGPHDSRYLFNQFFNDCRQYSLTKSRLRGNKILASAVSVSPSTSSHSGK